ncbi:hypothetical protein H1C71_018901 [Ictidomys tridecemlineatus]|nr:hypothetical protein H1C71_018901 [Ictidomys tridecemlineatus]
MRPLDHEAPSPNGSGQCGGAEPFPPCSRVSSASLSSQQVVLWGQTGLLVGGPQQGGGRGLGPSRACYPAPRSCSDLLSPSSQGPVERHPGYGHLASCCLRLGLEVADTGPTATPLHQPTFNSRWPDAGQGSPLTLAPGPRQSWGPQAQAAALRACLGSAFFLEPVPS